jgi:hypothetical protein
MVRNKIMRTGVSIVKSIITILVNKEKLDDVTKINVDAHLTVNGVHQIIKSSCFEVTENVKNTYIIEAVEEHAVEIAGILMELGFSKEEVQRSLFKAGLTGI